MRPVVSYEWEEPPADDVRGVPLPDPVREVLLSLTWPLERPPSKRFAPRDSPDEPVPRAEAIARVGQRLPAVGPAHLLAPDGEPLQQFWSCSRIAAGRMRLELRPTGADPASPRTRIAWSRWDARPFPPPETARRPHTGDSTDLTVRGIRVAVRVGWPGATRLLWLDPTGHSVRQVELRSPEPPLAAFERLVRDLDLLPGRP